MNPQAGFPRTRDPLEVIGSTARRLNTLMEGVSLKGAERRCGAWRWSIRQTLRHLAGTKGAFAFPWLQALRTFSDLREWNPALIRTMRAGELSRPPAYCNRGTMTFRALPETMGGHGPNHLERTEAAARAQ
jgi:hypothetical protein